MAGKKHTPEQALHRWKHQYGDLSRDQAKRLKELENENLKLKHTVSDQALNIQALEEIAARLHQLAEEHPRRGYRHRADLLGREAFSCLTAAPGASHGAKACRCQRNRANAGAGAQETPQATGALGQRPRVHRWQGDRLAEGSGLAD